MSVLRQHPTGSALAAIVALAATVRIATLGLQDFWFDEYLTLRAAELPFADIPAWVLEVESTPPLYFLIAAAWARVFGYAEEALRSFSTLAGIATVPVVFAAGRALASTRAGLIAAALTACSPLMIWYSQEARAYALVALLSALSFWCFAETLRGGDRRWLWAWALASAAAVCTHNLAGLPVALEAAWLLASSRPGRRLDVGLAAGAIAVCAIAVAPFPIAQERIAGWFELVSLEDRVWAVPQHMLVGLSVPWPLLGPLALGLAAAAGVWAWRGAEARLRRAFLVSAALCGAAAAVVLAAALVGFDYVNTRNLLPLWAAFAVGLGALAAASKAGTWLAGLACAAGIGLAVWTAATPAAARPDWSGVVAAFGPAETERVVITPPLATSIYAHLDRSRPVAPGEVISATEVGVVRLRPVDDYSIGPCWWLAFCGGRAIVGPSEPALEVPAGFELVDRGETDLFTYERWAAPEPVALPAPTGTDGVLFQEPG